MRLLLDTQVVLWQLGGERSLSTRAQEAIAEADDLLFSAVSYAEIGIPATPDRSFTVTKRDTIESVQAAHRRRCELSRRTMAALALDDVVEGRGARPVWALQLQVLRELAQHAGHADILREQILAARPG